MQSSEALEILRQIEGFKEAGNDVLQELSAYFHPLNVEPGLTFMKEGEPDDRMFIIQTGLVQVHTRDTVMTTMGEHEVVGEMAILGSGIRTMSVTALEPTSLFYIHKHDFFRLLDSRSEILRGIIEILINRFRRVNGQLIESMQTREKELRLAVEQKTQDLQEKNDELMRTQRFKEQFLANMSHEIRTPLNAIIGMVNLLRKTEVNDKQSNYLRTIKEASNNLRVIIDEILDFSKLEAGHVEMEAIEFSPADVVEQTLQMLTVQSQEKGLEFESIIEDSMPGLVVGDPVRLNQVLINLAGNAIKFTESGKVSIKARSLANDGSTAIIEFRVQDTGIGIPPEKQSTIWDKFTQAASDTKRRFGGTGLGLAISKQLVELQGGTIGLESEPGKGSTFHFQIPYPVVSQEASTESNEEVETSTQLKNLNVLLVEDNEFNVMVAVDTLEMEVEGISIDHAENGQVALDRLRDKDYDMILMDIQMPVMDGIEATRLIRQTKLNIGTPIVALTAHASILFPNSLSKICRYGS